MKRRPRAQRNDDTYSSHQFFFIALKPTNKVIKSLDYVITCAFFLNILLQQHKKVITTVNFSLVSTKCLTLLLHAERDSSVASLNPQIC